jgi:hypothetical protein
MPIRDLSTLGLGDLLGALLSAVVEGQRQTTASSIAFVEEVGLLRDGGGEERFRTVTLRYTKLDENQQPASFTLEVPLLAMVAIPTLTVRSAKVSFRYDITETSTVPPAPEEGDAAAPAVPRGPLGILSARPVLIRGVVPRPRPAGTATGTESAGVDVEVVVEGAPLPLGLERLLELTELTVSQPARDEQ